MPKWTTLMIRQETKYRLLQAKYKGQISSFDKVITSLLDKYEKEKEVLPDGKTQTDPEPEHPPSS